MRITPIELKATQLYRKLELGTIFDEYHDLMLSLLDEYDYLEDDDENDYKIALENLAKCEAIIKAQTILIGAKVN
jgi:hypothetical protein